MHAHDAGRTSQHKSARRRACTARWIPLRVLVQGRSGAARLHAVVGRCNMRRRWPREAMRVPTRLATAPLRPRLPLHPATQPAAVWLALQLGAVGDRRGRTRGRQGAAHASCPLRVAKLPTMAVARAAAPPQHRTVSLICARSVLARHGDAQPWRAGPSHLAREEPLGVWLSKAHTPLQRACCQVDQASRRAVRRRPACAWPATWVQRAGRRWGWERTAAVNTPPHNV
jgi:hypothetical protein